MEHAPYVVKVCLVVKQTKTHNHNLPILLYNYCGNFNELGPVQ